MCTLGELQITLGEVGELLQGILGTRSNTRTSVVASKHLLRLVARRSPDDFACGQ